MPMSSEVGDISKCMIIFQKFSCTNDMSNFPHGVAWKCENVALVFRTKKNSKNKEQTKIIVKTALKDDPKSGTMAVPLSSVTGCQVSPYRQKQ